MAIRFSLRHLPSLLAPPLPFAALSPPFPPILASTPTAHLPASTSSVLRHTPPCPLSSLAGWSVCAGLGVCLNLVMHGKGDEHLLVGQAVSSPLQTLTSNYSRAWAFLSLLSSPLLRFAASLSTSLLFFDLQSQIQIESIFDFQVWQI